MSSDAMNFVKRAISDNVVTVFSKTTCPHSTRAKSVLNSLSVKNMGVHELNERSDMSDIQDALQQLTGARTTPRVFIQGKCIGGADDVCSYVYVVW